MSDIKDVELSGLAKGLNIFCWFPMGPLTFFFLPLFMWWFLSTKYPKQLDRRGMTMRNGKRREWADLVRATPTRANAAGGLVSAGGVRLDFSDGSFVALVPNMISDPEGVLGFVSECVGSKIVAG
jgi:hypothetical protein